jgi:hypothetical protein
MTMLATLEFEREAGAKRSLLGYYARWGIDFMVDVPTVQGEAAALFRQVFGDLLADLIGLAGGDWISEYRRIRQNKLARDADEIMKERGVKIDPEKIQLPQVAALIKNASDESHPEIQDLWARLLAAALDPGRASKMRQEFVETVRAFDPVDALVFRELRNPVHGSTEIDQKGQLAAALKRNPTEIAASLFHLARLRCIYPANGPFEVNDLHLPTMRISSYGHELLGMLYN